MAPVHARPCPAYPSCIMHHGKGSSAAVPAPCPCGPCPPSPSPPGGAPCPARRHPVHVAECGRQRGHQRRAGRQRVPLQHQQRPRPGQPERWVGGQATLSGLALSISRWPIERGGAGRGSAPHGFVWPAWRWRCVRCTQATRALTCMCVQLLHLSGTAKWALKHTDAACEECRRVHCCSLIRRGLAGQATLRHCA